METKDNYNPTQNLQANRPLEKCTDCGSENLLEDKKQGDLICFECGLVLTSHNIDFTSEWRCFADDQRGKDPTRIGDPNHPLLESNSGTLISKGLRGANNLNERLATTQNQSNLQKTDRFLTQSFSKINLFLEKNFLFKGIKERVEELFKSYFDYLTLRSDGSRTRYSLRKDETLSSIAASIFIVSRNEGIPRTFREIYETTKVPKKEIGSRVRAIERSLRGVKISKIRNTEDFISRFCSKLGLPVFISRLAEKLAKTVREKEGLYGKNYISVSAASIHVISQLSPIKNKCTAKEIAKVAGISEITLRLTQKAMYPYRDKILKTLIPPNFNHYKLENSVENFLEN
ncbi:tfIIB (nucleomorph) [Hemiselmis andersenii]|uniref:General transcription factor TFIIB n=1 Tax=Hemiselmis andersenii TaxID=464988 RepID=A9BL15_HEMAN|nr:tfIIB [Hemiselmis andersenii]ABW98198.1 tfIIB [Hemiselmis andersenii]|mmetsp:Transcript_21634/g.50164  ORF Transcript_21634/g.50164 Transcript_21634/m.50164 type:complete len:345 (-) Transcript_21634:798-1832(-)